VRDRATDEPRYIAPIPTRPTRRGPRGIVEDGSTPAPRARFNRASVAAIVAVLLATGATASASGRKTYANLCLDLDVVKDVAEHYAGVTPSAVSALQAGVDQSLRELARDPGGFLGLSEQPDRAVQEALARMCQVLHTAILRTGDGRGTMSPTAARLLLTEILAGIVEDGGLAQLMRQRNGTLQSPNGREHEQRIYRTMGQTVAQLLGTEVARLANTSATRGKATEEAHPWVCEPSRELTQADWMSRVRSLGALLHANRNGDPDSHVGDRVH
jgi:hypothetical protein